MYCPQCATPLRDSSAPCPGCGFDTRRLAALIADGPGASARDTLRVRLERQRHSLGLLLVLCSMLVGCLIPLSMGVLHGAGILSAVILALAGLAGVLLVLGIMLILASERAILTASDSGADAAWEPAAPRRFAAPDDRAAPAGEPATPQRARR